MFLSSKSQSLGVENMGGWNFFLLLYKNQGSAPFLLKFICDITTLIFSLVLKLKSVYNFLYPINSNLPLRDKMETSVQCSVSKASSHSWTEGKNPINKVTAGKLYL